MSGTVTPLQTPVQSLGNALGVVGALNENRLFQARQAVGQALQQSTDPISGQVDPMQFNRLLSQNPDAALGMQDATNQSMGLQLQGQNLANNRGSVLSSALSSVLALPDDQLQAGAGQALSRLVGTGQIPWPMAAAAGQRLQGMSPPQLRNELQNMQLSSMSPQERQNTIYGTNGTVNTGGTIQPVTQASPMMGGGITQAGGPVTLTTGPETNAALENVTVPDPSRPGSFMNVRVPRSQLPGASGVAPISNGRYPTQQPQQPVLAGAPQAATMSNDADIKTYKDAQAQVPSLQQNVQNLSHAYDALQSIGTGPSSEAAHQMFSFLVHNGVDIGNLSDNVKNYDLFRKYTEKYALQQSANTDAGRNMAAASNAGVAISTPANYEVLKNEIGKQRQAIAQVMTAPDQAGIGYGGHSASFANSVDPRGFSYDLYSPVELQKMVSGMSPAAQTKFYRAVGIAKRLNLTGSTSQPTAAPSAAPPAQALAPSITPAAPAAAPAAPAAPAQSWTPSVPTGD